jgi:hypothetical protein
MRAIRYLCKGNNVVLCEYGYVRLSSTLLVGLGCARSNVFARRKLCYSRIEMKIAR